MITNGFHDAFRLAFFVSKDMIRRLISKPYLAGSEDRVSTNVYHGGLLGNSKSYLPFDFLHSMSWIRALCFLSAKIASIVYQ